MICNGGQFMKKDVENRPSKTAMGATLFRAIINYILVDSEIGSDNLARYFLPSILRNSLTNERFRTRLLNKYTQGIYEFILARTKFFDNLFVDALKGSIPQI
jgi:O-methyltransferase involved in polyketide biosynthesis